MAPAARSRLLQSQSSLVVTSSSSMLSVFVLAAALLVFCGLTACRIPVHPIEPTSACSRLRGAYPSEHGLILFPDTTTTTASIPWCFPAAKGSGLIGYNVNIPIARPGVFSFTLSDIRPPTRFKLTTIAGGCAEDNTGKSYVGLGTGTEWALTLAPGNHCFTLMKAENKAEDVWFTLTATRP